MGKPYLTYATLIAGRAHADLTDDDLQLLSRLIGERLNELTARHAWAATTEPERRKLTTLQSRIETIRLGMLQEVKR